MEPEPPSQKQLTTLLVRWREGDPQAAEQVIAAAYAELHKLAAWHMRGERSGHTLNATALVNELYLKLFGSEPVNWQNRAHFFAVAAQQLRRILINHARDRSAKKRGGKQIQVSLSEWDEVPRTRDEDLLVVDEALQRLETVDARAAKVVELRFFAGLSEAEASEVLDISVATLKRDWSFARAWLLRHLQA